MQALEKECPESVDVARDDALDGACLGCRQNVEGTAYIMKHGKDTKSCDLLCAGCYLHRNENLSQWSGLKEVCLSRQYHEDVKKFLQGITMRGNILLTFPVPHCECYPDGSELLGKVQTMSKSESKSDDGSSNSARVDDDSSTVDDDSSNSARVDDDSSTTLHESGDDLCRALINEFVTAYIDKFGDTGPTNHGERVRYKNGKVIQAGHVRADHVRNSEHYIHGSCDGMEGVKAFAAGVELLKHASGQKTSWDLKDTMYFFSGLCTGKEPTGTGFHLDITRGVNVAFDMGGGTAGTVLALWLFLSPDILDDVDAFLKNPGEHDLRDYPGLDKLSERWNACGGFSLPPLIKKGECVLHGEDTKAMKAYALPVLSKEEIEMIHKKFPTTTVLVQQKHGGVVHVPPGWVHCVTNLSPNWKLARDFFVEEEMPSYAFFLKKIGSRVFGQRMAADYMSLDKKCRDALHVAYGRYKDTELKA